MPDVTGSTVTTPGDLNEKTQNLPQPRKGRPAIFQEKSGGQLAKVSKRVRHRMETPAREISRFTKKP